MRIHFGQIYIEPGIDFPFSHHFQSCLAQAISPLVRPSQMFLKKYGDDFKLIFNISAKQAILDNEIKGPTVFKKSKAVEFTLFLPFDVINHNEDVTSSALHYLLKGVCSVLDSLGIDSARILEQQESLKQTICSDPAMFEARGRFT